MNTVTNNTDKYYSNEQHGKLYGTAIIIHSHSILGMINQSPS